MSLISDLLTPKRIYIPEVSNKLQYPKTPHGHITVIQGIIQANKQKANPVAQVSNPKHQSAGHDSCHDSGAYGCSAAAFAP